MGRFRRSEAASNKTWDGAHRFEHWYRDNTVYFITARCRGHFPAFASEEAKAIFWQRFEFATQRHGFQPWVTSLLDNHYHTIGWLRIGMDLPEMMRLLHGGTAKLVNDLLEQQYHAGEIDSPILVNGRLKPFWSDSRKQNYFDGCLRDRVQGRRTYRYVLTQAERHGIVRDYREYAHTRVAVPMEEALWWAEERRAFMEGVRYKRYDG